MISTLNGKIRYFNVLMGTLEIFSQKKQKTQLHVSETALQSSRFALIKKKKVLALLLYRFLRSETIF